MKKYTFKIHPLLYIVLSALSGFSLYTIIFEDFYFALVGLVMFGTPLLLLLVVQTFKLNSLEIHQDRVVFGFFKKVIIRRIDFISIEVKGDLDMDYGYVIIRYNSDGVQKEDYLLRIYNVKLKVIYEELVEYFYEKQA